jgi:predicted GTPase
MSDRNDALDQAHTDPHDAARADVPAPRRLLILGAAGRDFHVFNTLYRDDPAVRVVGFTAAQIPHIDDRRYPAALAGALYPEGIAIHPQSELDALVRGEAVDEVVFAYSDVSQLEVMTLAEQCLALGCQFTLPGPARTMLAARVPVVAVSAVRTGCGKSPLSRWLGRELRSRGRRIAVIRHPMPYGDLVRQRVQRFASAADLDAAQCTAEEREEYEAHLAAGNLVFAGVDYAQVLQAAQREADMIIWDGGNNDFPFVRPNLHLVMVDAWRPEHARGWHPGEAVLRCADVIIVSKTDTAVPADVQRAAELARSVNPSAELLYGRSQISADHPELLHGRRVLAIEDGPTLTHGGMSIGAAALAVRAAGGDLVDPRPHAPTRLARLLAQYPNLGPVLPALGYSADDLDDIEATIAATPCDVIAVGTPIDLARLVRISRPIVRVHYEFSEAQTGALGAHLDALLRRFPFARQDQLCASSRNPAVE